MSKRFGRRQRRKLQAEILSLNLSLERTRSQLDSVRLNPLSESTIQVWLDEGSELTVRNMDYLWSPIRASNDPDLRPTVLAATIVGNHESRLYMDLDSIRATQGCVEQDVRRRIAEYVSSALATQLVNHLIDGIKGNAQRD